MKQLNKIFVLILLCYATICSAQSDSVLLDTKINPESNVKLGLDFSKSIFINFDTRGRGFVIEPVAYFKPQADSKLMIKSLMGFTKFRADTIFNNSILNNNGFHTKIGVGAQFNRVVSAYALLTTSYNKVNIEYFFEGDYFDGFVGSDSFIEITTGLEFDLDLTFNISDKLDIINTTRINMFTLNSPIPNTSRLNYYVPGMGFTGNSRVAVGISFALLYRL